MLDHFTSNLPGEQVVGGEPANLLGSAAGRGGKGGVAAQVMSFEILVENPVGNRIDERLERRLLPFFLLIGAFQAGDVLEGTDAQSALIVPGDESGHFDVEDAAVFSTEHSLECYGPVS